MVQKIGIIGAAASGMPAVKVCKENGFEPICFERTSDIGGLWRFREDTDEWEACVMKSTIINTCKEMMSYSDFPPPKELPNYMHNTKVLQYLRMYCDRFDLIKHVRFNTFVTLIKRAKDYDQTGRWEIQYKDKDGNEGVEVVDAVMLATGHHANPYMAKWKGMDKFKGKILHSHDYKDQKGYEDQRIVVVGVGNSGGDAAVELGRICKQVWLVSRRGTWVLNRVGDKGKPFDANFNFRLAWWLIEKVPAIINGFMGWKLNQRFDHANFGLKPNHGLFQAHPTVNDDLPNRIISGTVIIKPGIRELTERDIIFEDGSVAENVDTLLVATGYNVGFPFLEEGLIPVYENSVDLYKWVLPPKLPHPTLGIIGMIQPYGAVQPISEMQARWLCEILTGRMKKPDQKTMEMDIQRKKEEMAERYVASRRHTIQVDYVTYMDELGDEMGVTPKFWEYFFKDPLLAKEIIWGSCSPYQYRLKGPNAWPGARDAIMSTWDRIRFPTRTRRVPGGHKHSGMYYASVVVIVLLAIFLFFFMFI